MVARPQRPLVLLLDDLQWADRSSLSLLEHLLAHSETRHVMVVGTFRDSEVHASHPLTATLAVLRKTLVPLEIHLGPLAEAAVQQLLADTLRCDVTDAADLAVVVQGKTQNNPFFVNQFLQSLHQDRLISLDAAAGRWRWDAERIREAGVTGNVADLLSGHIAGLEPATQDVLKLAATLGNRFSLRDLALITHLSPATGQAPGARH